MAGVVVVLVLATGGTNGGVQPAPAPILTSASAAASGPRDGASPSSSSAQSAPTVGSQAPILTGYRGSSISAEIPSGWKTVEDEAHKPGYIESKWEDVGNPGDTVLIDTSPSTPGTLEHDAAPVHEALTRESGYQEIFYGPGDLSGVRSWKWVFRVEGDERIDYFFNHCASGYAVLGSSPPSHFARLEATFKAVAESVHPSSEPGC